MSHNSDSDGDWIPLPPQSDSLNPPKLTPEGTGSSCGTMQRKLSDKGWALVDKAKKSHTIPPLETTQKHTKANNDPTSSTSSVLPDLSLLGLVKSEDAKVVGTDGTPRRITEPVMKDHDAKFQELEAGVKSLNSRMDAIKVSISELRAQFHDLEVLLAAQGLVRSAHSERGT